MGFQEFFQTYPQAQVEIYHKDYANLPKFAYGDLIEDICEMYSQIQLYNHDIPVDLNCDLYIELSSELQLTWSSDNRIPSKTRVTGSLNLRDFIGSNPEKGFTIGPQGTVMEQLKHFKHVPLVSHDFNFDLLSIELSDTLRIPDKGDIRTQIKTLREMVVEAMKPDNIEAQNWFVRFCKANNLKDDLNAINKLLRMGADWNRIKSQLRTLT